MVFSYNVMYLLPSRMKVCPKVRKEKLRTQNYIGVKSFQNQFEIQGTIFTEFGVI